MKPYTPKYWNSKGRYQKTYNQLSKKLVPAEGEAKTVHGECLRIVSRYYYDKYNNGNFNIDSPYFVEMGVKLTKYAYALAGFAVFPHWKDPDIILLLIRDFVQGKLNDMQTDEFVDTVIRYVKAVEEA